MRGKKLLTQKGFLVLEIEYRLQEVGYWTPINKDGVIGEFENSRSRTFVVRDATQIESINVPTYQHMQEFENRKNNFQKSIKTTDASG